MWRTNPHLDPKVRGRKTAELVVRAAKGEINPVQWIEMPPMYINIVKQFTGEDPMMSLRRRLPWPPTKRPGILDTSVAEGYPYSDVEKMGMSWVAIADNDHRTRQIRRQRHGRKSVGTPRRTKRRSRRRFPMPSTLPSPNTSALETSTKPTK